MGRIIKAVVNSSPINHDERGALVSCIMPTYDRRKFIPQAIQYFLRQDYPYRELIIVDDGDDCVSDLVPDDPIIRYIRLDRRYTLGAKRNVACKEADGQVIIHWDDDDWMASWRISYQVESLLEAQTDMCGVERLLFYDPVANLAWHYIYPQKKTPLLAGGSLCYRKCFWKRSGFPEINLGEDTRFILSDRPKKISVLKDETFYVALNHRGNTNPRNTKGKRWHPCGIDKIRQLMGKDWSFYTNLSENTYKDEKKNKILD